MEKIENLDREYILHIKSDIAIENRLLGRLLQDVIDVFEGTEIKAEIAERCAE